MSQDLLTTIPADKEHHAKMKHEVEQAHVVGRLKNCIKRAVQPFIWQHTPEKWIDRPFSPVNGWDMAAQEAHPVPKIRRTELMRRAHQLRFRGRCTQLLRTVEALDLTNTRHKRWLAHVTDYLRHRSSLGSRVEDYTPGHYWSGSGLGLLEVDGHQIIEGMFDYRVPFSVPDGIPVGTLTTEEQEHYLVPTPVWEVEMVAALELEEHCGGWATFLLHDQLPDPGQKRLKARATVETCLMVNRQNIPVDPWDTNLWGHDARLKSLSVTDSGSPVTISPKFDPEVLAYTMNNPISGSNVFYQVYNSLATASLEYAADSTSLTITVTAKDGITKRVYTLSVV